MVYVLPEARYVPAGQRDGVFAATVHEYPRGHVAHDELVDALAYVPDGHAVQLVIRPPTP